MGGHERSTGLDSEEGKFEEKIRLIPNAGWPECYFGDYGHMCNVVHVSEGMDGEGLLYIRRGWALDSGPPEDCVLHNWKPTFDPANGDTLEDPLAHIHGLIELDFISPEEHSKIEWFYRRLFTL